MSLKISKKKIIKSKTNRKIHHLHLTLHSTKSDRKQKNCKNTLSHANIQSFGHTIDKMHSYMKKIPLGVFMHASEDVIKMSRRKPINRSTVRKNYTKAKSKKNNSSPSFAQI